MKKITLSFLILGLFTLSCNNAQEKQEIEQLRLELEELRNQKLEEESKKAVPKYVWSVIQCKTGTYSYNPSDGTSGYKNLKNTIYWSEITEVMDFNENSEYKSQDDLENKLRQRYGRALHSIQERETFAFDTYKEASEFRYNRVNR